MKIPPYTRSENEINRRVLIKSALLTGGAIALTTVPLAAYVIFPAIQKGSGRWIELGSIEDLPEGNFEMLTFEFMVKDGWVVLPQRGFVWARSVSESKFQVFSSTCTHLACNVIWQETSRSFVCPCHSGKFDENGDPQSGPPTKPLRKLEHKVEDKQLLVYMTV